MDRVFSKQADHLNIIFGILRGMKVEKDVFKMMFKYNLNFLEMNTDIINSFRLVLNEIFLG